MTIETKFAPGDEVFFMEDNKVATRTVRRVAIDCDLDAYSIVQKVTKYYVHGTEFYFEPKDLFATKEELLASL